LRSAITWLLRRYDVASSSAASLASVPEEVKNTLASGTPDSAAIFSASSTCVRSRYSVEVCTTPRSTCSLIASRTSGTSYPSMLVRMPAKKSR
jgi:hypothetical protein